jgi:hypothetical protein
LSDLPIELAGRVQQIKADNGSNYCDGCDKRQNYDSFSALPFLPANRQFDQTNLDIMYSCFWKSDNMSTEQFGC